MKFRYISTFFDGPLQIQNTTFVFEEDHEERSKYIYVSSSFNLFWSFLFLTKFFIFLTVSIIISNRYPQIH